MGILLFVLNYMYISLLLKMINGFSWPAKIMASPFKIDFNICENQKNEWSVWCLLEHNNIDFVELPVLLCVVNRVIWRENI